MTLPKGHFSHSQVNMYLRCGYQYYLHYVKGLSFPPGWVMIRGDALDAAIEADMSQKIVTGKNLSPERYHEIISEVVETKVQEVRTDDPDLVEAGGPVEVAKNFLSTTGGLVAAIEPWANRYQPTAVQKEVSGDVGGYPMLGFLDLKSSENIITDTKFFNSKKQEDTAEKSNQLRLYQILERKAGEPSRGAEFFGVYPSKKGNYGSQTLTQKANVEEELRLEEVVHSAGRGVEAGIFAPVNKDSQMSWVCTQRFCGFWDTVCPYGRAGRKTV